MDKNNSQKPKDAFDDELINVLYQRYAMGGTRFARWRLNFMFWSKKMLWVFVVNSLFLFKRIVDILASGILLICLSPVFAATALAIKFEDPGPVFFSQKRVGKWGKFFTMHKFRSMIMNADKVKDELLEQNESEKGVIFKMKDDPRITKVGKFIRKYSIDELPQLWNVFVGDMSLVGPRPPVPREVSEYKNLDRRRLEVKPGITCIWQVSGRSDIDFEGQVKLDVQYIQNQSFWGDILILLKTIPAVLLGKGAY